MKNYFMPVQDLVKLEKQQDWELARAVLYQIWEEDKENADKLIRVLSECWYVLSLWDCCIETDNLSYSVFQGTLRECMEFGEEKFQDNTKFLCITGYMLSLLPHLFYNSEPGFLYEKWEEKGREMLQKACESDNSDVVAKVLYYGGISFRGAYCQGKVDIASVVEDIFPEQTAIEQYFKEILLNN